MAEKIRVEIEDASSKGLDSIEQNANKAANAVDKLGDEAKQTGQQLADASKRSEGLGGTESLARLVKFGAALAAARAATQGLIASVKAMDDDGSPAFKNLTNEAEGIYEALISIGNDPAVQGWIQAMADSIKTSLVPAIKSIPHALRDAHEEAANLFTRLGEQLGIFEEGTQETNLEIRKMNEEILKQREEAIAKEKERANVDEKVASIERKINEEREQANIKNLNDATTLNILLQDEIEALKEMERTGERDRTKKEASLKKIETIQRTLSELPGKISAAEVKAQEESSKARADAEAEYQETVKAATLEANRVRDEAIKKTVDVVEAKRQELLKLIEEAKGIKGGNAIQEAKEGIDKGQVLKQIQKSHGDEAEAKLREELTAKGELDQNGKAIDSDPAERARKQRQIDEQIRRARGKAGAEAFRDARGGRIDSSEIDKAQTDLLKAQIEGNKGSMGIASTANNLATDALNNSQATQNALAQQNQQIDEIRQQLAASTAAINKNSARGRVRN